jgi:dihydroflavonol-4-reductase
MVEEKDLSGPHWRNPVTVVVTGAAGHVGGNLVRALLARGRSVRALVHHDRRALENLDLEVIQGDICDLTFLRRAFVGAETVFHTAAYISLLKDDWPRLEQVNIGGTRNVVQACLDCGVGRLVHFSSIHALVQEPPELPVDESRPLADFSWCLPYDRSKAGAEREVLCGIERGLDAVILNPTAIIGPYDYKPSHFGEVLLALAEGRLPALVDGGFDWVDVRDVVEGAIQAEARAAFGPRYLLAGHWVSLRDIAAAVETITGSRAPRFVCPAELALLAAPFITALFQLLGKRPLFTSVSLEIICNNRRVSHERATRELGYSPRAFRETLEDTFRWFAQAGCLVRPLNIPYQETTWTNRPSSTV